MKEHVVYVLSVVIHLSLPLLLTVGSTLLLKVKKRRSVHLMLSGAIITIISVIPSLVINPTLPFSNTLPPRLYAIAVLVTGLIRQSGYTLFAIGFVAFSLGVRRESQNTCLEHDA